MVALAGHVYFDYGESMNVEDADASISGIAAAIAEPARTRMLCCLLDGRARTGTELAIVGGVSASTASAHLAKLVERRLVEVTAQGRHRYYLLHDANVAAALEALTVVAGAPLARFTPNTPERLRAARTCYDHMAGALAVALHDRMFALGWLSNAPAEGNGIYQVTRTGAEALGKLGVDMAAARGMRRRFACGCLDWSERRPHLAGALGAALLDVVLKRQWMVRDLDSRALAITRNGRRALRERLGIEA
jgi:DNA-binding transcriptional ArsR family regulator